MIRTLAFLVAVAALLVMVVPVKADWNLNDPYKWLQIPNATGYDVNATWNGTTYKTILADDFQCTSTDPITDIHIWGSWLGDNVEYNTQFKLSIHADVAAGVNSTYSHPGNLLWSQVISPSNYSLRQWATGTEQFYDPNTSTVIGSDTITWQYNFENFASPFIQQGTLANPVIYWLDVQAILPTNDSKVFGWKTTLPQSMQPTVPLLDDSVHAITAIAGGDPVGPANPPVYWVDMHYPQTGESIDQAFVITPEPTTLCLLGVGVLGLIRRRR